MRDFMFRNRWGALFFVGLTLAGVTTLVGTKDRGGAIQQATDQIEQTKAQAEMLANGETSEPLVIEGDEIELASDEELIDPATGEDPTPIDEFAPPIDPDKPEEAAVDEVVIVSRGTPDNTVIEDEAEDN